MLWKNKKEKTFEEIRLEQLNKEEKYVQKSIKKVDKYMKRQMAKGERIMRIQYHMNYGGLKEPAQKRILMRVMKHFEDTGDWKMAVAEYEPIFGLGGEAYVLVYKTHWGHAE